MACSLAQLESNRRNAERSTGPRTPEGKARSRANGLKHGLTGAGIVLPTEDVEEVDRRFEALEAEMKPGGELALQLVKRVALMTVRLDRSAEHEARAISHRMRRAAADFDEARLSEVDRMFSWLATEPATHARRLRASPEGIDRLIAALEGLKSDLDRPDGVRWDWQHCEHLHHLMGLRRLDLPMSRPRVLSEAIEGRFQNLEASDRPELAGLDRQCWAAGALLRLVEGEIAGLRSLRATLDHEGLELDRSEAAARAIFDPSPAATLARKYEAVAERGLFRTLREFREVQAQGPPTEPTPNPNEPETLGPLGSSFPDGTGAVEAIHEGPPEAGPPASEPPDEAPRDESADDASDSSPSPANPEASPTRGPRPGATGRSKTPADPRVNDDGSGVERGGRA